MKIGINASYLRKPYTGIGQVTVNFLHSLNKSLASDPALKDIEVVLYLEEDCSKEFKFSNRFILKVFLPFWKRDDLIRKMIWERILLPSQVKKDRCDVLFSLFQCPTHAPKGVRHLMLVHDLIPRIFPEYLNNSRKKLYQKMTESAIREANHIMAVSEKTKSDLITKLHIAKKKISVSYIDVDPLYKKEVSEKKSREVMKKYKLEPGYIYAAGLEKRKNIAGVIMAYNFLWTNQKETPFMEKFPKLVISGKMMPELAPLVTDVEDLRKKHNLTKNIKLLGLVPQEDLPVLYKNASVFVFPSFYEGFGLPVLEAMNQETAVITSRLSSLPEVGGDGVVYCNPNDVKDIALNIKDLLTDESLRKTTAHSGKARCQFFSWDKFLQKFFQITLENKK